MISSPIVFIVVQFTDDDDDQSHHYIGPFIHVHLYSCSQTHTIPDVRMLQKPNNTK